MRRIALGVLLLAACRVTSTVVPRANVRQASSVCMCACPCEAGTDTGPDAGPDVADVVEAASDVIDAADGMDVLADSFMDAPPDGPPPPWVISSPTFVTSALYQSFPLLMRAPNGTIFQFYRESTAHAGTAGYLQAQTSTDDGATWSVPWTFAASPGLDVREAAGGVTASGALVVAWWVVTTAGTAGAGTGVFVVRSTDSGATWSAPTQLIGATRPYPAGAYQYDIVYGQLVVTPLGPGLVLGKYLPGNPWEYLVLSHDDGVTWTDERPLATAAMPRMPTAEIALAYAGGTSLVGWGRNARSVWTSTDGAIPIKYPLEFQSVDLGLTWSITTPTIPLSPCSIPPTYNCNPAAVRSSWEDVSPWVLVPGLDAPSTVLTGERTIWSPTFNVGRLSALPLDLVTGAPGTPAYWVSMPTVDFGYPTTAPIASGYLVEFMAAQTSGGPENRGFFTVTR